MKAANRKLREEREQLAKQSRGKCEMTRAPWAGKTTYLNTCTGEVDTYYGTRASGAGSSSSSWKPSYSQGATDRYNRAVKHGEDQRHDFQNAERWRKYGR